MIEPGAVSEIIAQYKKHGWVLRRALLSEEARNNLAGLLADVSIKPSTDLNALWFWRRSNPDNEAWELRRLSHLPFALVAVVSTSASGEEVESTLVQVESDMRERTIA